MGMILELVTLGDDNIARLLADPPLVWRVISPDEPELYEAETAPKGLARLFWWRRRAVPQIVFGSGEGRREDLDKAWHGVHYLLTGDAGPGDSPLDFLITGGQEVGDLEVGWAPARALNAAQTAAVAQTLRATPDDVLRARFVPEDMNTQDVYGSPWDGSPGTIDYLMGNVRVLRELLDAAAEHRVGLIVCLL